MGGAYPELIAQKTLIEKVIKEEEDAFLRTLETGIRLLDKKIEDLQVAGQKTLSGSDAFTLYDTYGFPLDLTELILREHHMDVNIDEFNVEMQKQKERARNAAAVETGDWVTLKEGETEFVGYDLFECDAEILRYRQVKQKNKVLYQLVLDRTPFYAEMGGQVGDTGWLINGDEKVNILDTKRENNLPIHIVEKLPQDVTAGFTAKINVKKRIQCECNHSATHLLHEALREVLGKHVEQKGSYVSPEALRFDFSHFQKVTDEEIRQVEKLVSEKIRANYALEEYRNMPIEQAKEMGAMALFGEKYGDNVRVVKYGSSVELCGGTHIPATGMIGSLRVVSESSVAAGVRRIEAITAEAAENYTFMLQDSLRELRAMFNNVPNLAQTIRKSIEENAELKKEVQEDDEETGKTNRFTQRILGIGINVNQREFTGSAPNPVSLANILGREVSRDELLGLFIDAFKSYLGMVDAGRYDDIHAGYAAALYRREGFHAYRDATGEFMAAIERVEPDGRFVLRRADGSESGYLFKEVECVLPTPALPKGGGLVSHN